MSVEGYLRNRRLAYGVAAASVLLLALWIWAGGVADTYYRRPTVITGGPQILVLHDALRARTPQDVFQVVVPVDPATFQPGARYALYGGATAVARSPKGVVAFYGRRWSLLDADAARTAELPGAWTVQAAMGDAAGLWLFGVEDGALRARRLEEDRPGDEETVARLVGTLASVVAAASPEGPTVAWREEGRTTVSLARRRAGRWETLEAVDIGPAGRWTTVPAGPRQLVVAFDRRDRAWRTATFRVWCCASCGRPAPPARWTFQDPLRLGRYLTGLSAALDGDRIVLCLTRTSSVQLATLPASTLAPDPGASLAHLPLESRWRPLITYLLPTVVLFFSFSLIYLGFVLMRERRQFLLAALGVREPPGPRPAEVMQRVMAYLIDLMILMPFQFFVVESFELLPLAPDYAVDAGVLQAWGLVWAIEFAYFFTLELAAGQTIGKRLIGIRVQRRDGSRPGLRGALLRNLLRVVDASPILGLLALPLVFVPLLGIVFIAATTLHRRPGDLAAGTVVQQETSGAGDAGPGTLTLRDVLERAARRAKQQRDKP
jgi:uncharacterized RDD family membrane protein YckC